MPKTQDNIRHYYEERYGATAWPEASQNLKRIRSNLQALQIAAGDRVLDVGCGLGLTGLYLAEQGASPIGIDISSKACRLARGSGGYLATAQASAELLPFAALSFDTAVFMGTLEHFVDPAKALREAIRVLRPGAQLAFVVPNSSFFLFRFLGGTGQPHEVPRSYEGWHQLFEAEGLTIDTVYRDVGPKVADVGRLLRSWIRSLVLFFSNLMPLRYTYQFVFISHIPVGTIQDANAEIPVYREDGQ
jgi:SAM-dependent methyltransferase